MDSPHRFIHPVCGSIACLSMTETDPEYSGGRRSWKLGHRLWKGSQVCRQLDRTGEGELDGWHYGQQWVLRGHSPN